MAKDIKAAVREICLSFAQVEDRVGHGMPDYKVRGKSFALLAINHHGDGRIALWLHAPPGAQHQHPDGKPAFYFAPPYVGPKGWLGVHLDRGNDWFAITMRTRDRFDWDETRALALGSYRHFALKRMLKALPDSPSAPGDR